MDPRFLYFLGQASVLDAQILALAESGVDYIGMFAHLASDEVDMMPSFRAVLDLDVETRPADFIPRAKLLVQRLRLWLLKTQVRCLQAGKIGF